MSFDSTKKNISNAFGKNCYYLGLDGGVPVWLEQEKWDCGWYWGCGYVETYTNSKDPSLARDINCHTHINSMFKATPFYEIAKCKDELGFTAPHLTASERWKLADLFKTMYTLKEAAAVLGRGGSHLAEAPSFDKDPFTASRINNKLLPKVFDAIRVILTPATAL
jgi:hypothetical protein